MVRNGIVFSLVAVVAGGCVVHNATGAIVAAPRDQQDIVMLQVADLGSETFGYVIDRRAQRCYFRDAIAYNDGAGLALVAVPCSSIKRTTPEAAAHISWSDAADAAYPAAAPSDEPTAETP
jgi:hypothetical protein